MTKILVTSVRGKTGRHVAAQLAAEPGVEVLGATSAPFALDIDNVRPVQFDWSDAPAESEVLRQVDALYLARPEVEDAPEQISALLRRAPELQRVVLLSEMGAETMHPDSWVARVEQAVRDHARSWTVLRPSWFSQVLIDDRFFLTSIRDERRVEVPSAGARVSFIDARDIAAAAVSALRDDSHAGCEYTLSGPRAFPWEEVARLLTAAAAAHVHYVDCSIDDATSSAAAWSEPWFVAVLREVYEQMTAGVYGELSDDVKHLIGREPIALEVFIAEHAALWRAVQRSPRDA